MPLDRPQKDLKKNIFYQNTQTPNFRKKSPQTHVIYLIWKDFQDVFSNKEEINRISAHRASIGKERKGKNGKPLKKKDVVFDNSDLLAQTRKPNKTEQNSALKLQPSLYDTQEKSSTMAQRLQSPAGSSPPSNPQPSPSLAPLQMVLIKITTSSCIISAVSERVSVLKGTTSNPPESVRKTRI